MSAIPAATLLARPWRRGSRPRSRSRRLDRVARGRVDRARLPAVRRSGIHARVVRAVRVRARDCRADLTHAVLGGEGGIAPKATLTVGVRHLGLVLALAIGAPLLAGDLLAGADAAKLNAAAVIIDGEIRGRRRSPGSGHPRRARARAEGRDPGLRGRVRGGRCGDRRRRSAGARRLGRDDRTGRHQGFRPSFLFCALLAAAGSCRSSCSGGGGWREPPDRGRGAGRAVRRSGGLIALEFTHGAADAGALAIHDPCEPRSAFPGEGIDATLQRIVSDGLDGAACELGTTREGSCSPSRRAPASSRSRGTTRRSSAPFAPASSSRSTTPNSESLGGLLAVALRQVVEHAPVQWLIDGGQGIAGLFD